MRGPSAATHHCFSPPLLAATTCHLPGPRILAHVPRRQRHKPTVRVRLGARGRRGHDGHGAGRERRRRRRRRRPAGEEACGRHCHHRAHQRVAPAVGVSTKGTREAVERERDEPIRDARDRLFVDSARHHFREEGGRGGAWGRAPRLCAGKVAARWRGKARLAAQAGDGQGFEWCGCVREWGASGAVSWPVLPPPLRATPGAAVDCNSVCWHGRCCVLLLLPHTSGAAPAAAALSLGHRAHSLLLSTPPP